MSPATYSCSTVLDASDNPSRLFESGARHQDDVEGVGQPGERLPHAQGLRSAVRYLVGHDQEVDVAVRGHGSRGRRAEQNHARRTEDLEDVADDFRDLTVGQYTRRGRSVRGWISHGSAPSRAMPSASPRNVTPDWRIRANIRSLCRITLRRPATRT